MKPYQQSFYIISFVFAMFLVVYGQFSDRYHRQNKEGVSFSENSLYGGTLKYNVEDLADAIYLAEGGASAKKPYGILSVYCETEADCREICINTIKNNVGRYKLFGHKEYPTFLEFLQSRYAPTENVSDFDRNLNQHWLTNVRYFLTNPKD